MPEISTDTMLIAIQAVAAQVRHLEIAADADDAAPELEMLIEKWVDAADDLARAYDISSRTVLNLPPYDTLITG